MHGSPSSSSDDSLSSLDTVSWTPVCGVQVMSLGSEISESLV